MHIPSSTVDITSGGGIDEEASWGMHEKEVLKNLERTFETNFMKPGHLAFKCKPISEDSLMDFQQFQRKVQVDRPSAFTYMLQRHGRSMVYMIDWVISKLVQICKAQPMFNSEGSKEW